MQDELHANSHTCLCGDVQSSSTIKDKNPQHYPQYTFLIAYGAKDSVLPGGPRSRNYVPLDEYSSNLKDMIHMIQTWNTEQNVAMALLTSPPCDTDVPSTGRDNENVTKLYTEACVKVASDMGVPVVDLWNGMILPTDKNIEEETSFKSKQQWKVDSLSDGVHLTLMGNYRLYELVFQLLEDQSASADDVEKGESSGLGLVGRKFPRSYPDHNMVDAKNPEKSFGTENY